MREVFGTIRDWLRERRRFAAATLIGVRDAAPAPLGTTLAVDDGLRIAGSIGAGCHEGAIVEAALQAALDGRARLYDVDLTEEDGVAPVACGASLRVALWVPDHAFAQIADRIARGDESVRCALPDTEFALEVAARAPLLIVGATALAARVAALARHADFHTTLVDPRPAFATTERVPEADVIVREWPDVCLPHLLDASSAIVVLSHDRKFDVPALRSALRSGARYIGYLGSRRSQAAMQTVLRSEGFGDADLARIHGPVGLDLGGRAEPEIAVAIVAELIAARHGAPGWSLSEARALHA